jgi:hypothetical protein
VNITVMPTEVFLPDYFEARSLLWDFAGASPRGAERDRTHLVWK